MNDKTHSESQELKFEYSSLNGKALEKKTTRLAIIREKFLPNLDINISESPEDLAYSESTFKGKKKKYKERLSHLLGLFSNLTLYIIIAHKDSIKPYFVHRESVLRSPKYL